MSATSAPISRFSISLPGELLEQLDSLVTRRRLPSRSQILAELIRGALVEDELAADPERVVAGTMTLVYNAQRRGTLRQRMAQIQRRYIKEIISSQHVFLEREHSLEVLLVQGPGHRLSRLADETRALKGVEQVRMSMTRTLVPPLHE
ncbi:MAG TPA: ribbon-helix-helix protein, CopG family [Tepidisphaeraceae bacterium]|nr:ribbon-helix-helix protein, CopG family [Tepidisphaeraceae bacterium]